MVAILDRVTVNDDGCWEYDGCTRGSYGHWYGAMSYHGSNTSTHRIVYEAYYGKIPNERHVCHRCDNTKCCNPEHLFLGTALDNHNDAVAKGRTMDRRKI